MFLGSPNGSFKLEPYLKPAPVHYSGDMDPHLYFMQLLVNLPTWPARDLDAWLPDRWKQTHIARCAALGIPAPPNP